MVESLCPEVAAASDRRLVVATAAAAQAADRPGRPARTGLARAGPTSKQARRARWRTWTAAQRRLCCRATSYNIQFTSGTTGLPKGAMLTHRNVLMNAYYVGQRLRYTAEDRVCVPVPFYHCFGCVLGNLVCAVYGATIVVPAPGVRPGGDARGHRGRALHLGLRRADDVRGRARASRLRRVRPLEPAHRDHGGGPCPLPLDGEGRERDGRPRDLHRLRPDRGLADHHVHLGRRPDRGPRRHRRPADPRGRGQAGRPGHRRRDRRRASPASSAPAATA